MTDITVNIPSSNTTLRLPEAVFGCDINVPLIHQVVVAQLAAARQGTHSTKTRGEVSGGGAKPWRQKGTGRARQGSRRAPQWTGGGAVFGPQPRSYAQRTPKKMIAAALKSALSDRVADGKLFVLESIIDSETPSTRQALEALAVIGDAVTAVVVLTREEDVAYVSLRNVPYIHALVADQLNVYDVIANEAIVFTKPALDEFLARFGTVVLEAEAPAPAEKPAKKAKKEAVTAGAATPLEADADEPAEPAVPATEPEPTEPEPAEPAAPADEAKDYGEGSYRGETPPDGYDIKGNEDSMLYHTPDSPWYKRTVAEVWFNSAEAAEAAGFKDVMEGKK
jgi:large subunit ribosomal protein L4